MEMKIAGVHACLMAYQKRPNEIVKIFLTDENVKTFSDVLKWCAAHKKSYKITTSEDIERVSGSTHHEGVCFYVKKSPLCSVSDFLEKYKFKKSCVVALENVENPHNVGALLRVCANFGVTALLIKKAPHFQNAAVFRTAEGGAEWVEFIDCDNLTKAVLKFKTAGYKVFTTSSHVGRSPSKIKFSDKTLFVFGSEKLGISRDLLTKGDAIISIPSTGNVESLNVTCAASILLSAYYENIA